MKGGSIFELHKMCVIYKIMVEGVLKKDRRRDYAIFYLLQGVQYYCLVHRAGRCWEWKPHRCA